MKPTDKAERKLQRLAESESRIHARLLDVRDEIDVIAREIDKVIVPRRVRRGGLGVINNLVPFTGLTGRKIL